jgi:hypothetical protein
MLRWRRQERRERRSEVEETGEKRGEADCKLTAGLGTRIKKLG